MLSTSGCVFQSTRPLRGATPTAGAQRQGTGISIHAPLAGRDVTFSESGSNWVSFQSTRPLRGATGQDRTGVGGGLYFNPRAPCGARPLSLRFALLHPDFQSTRPLRGATSLSALCPPPPGISIHAPLAGRDAGLYQEGAGGAISIHAPLAGRDRCKHNLPHAPLDFNPRAPCGARRTAWTTSRPCANFNPRAPCGARLDRLLRVAIVAPISIHAPLAGRDRRAAPA